MRFAFALMLVSVTSLGCASKPPPAAPPDVPMYTNKEWSQMNTASSVPEIPDQQLATTDAPPPSPASHGSGRFVYGVAPNTAGNPGGSSTNDSVGATAQPPVVRPSIPPAKPKSNMVSH